MPLTYDVAHAACRTVLVLCFCNFAFAIHCFAESPPWMENAASLNRISSYHLRIVMSSSLTVDGKEVLPYRRDSVMEIWREGIRRKHIHRVFRKGTPSGIVSVEQEHGQVTQSSADEREIRNLRGWDPEHPYQLPLEFGRSAVEYGSVKGTIGLRSPKETLEWPESSMLLWQIAPGLTLEEVAKHSTLTEVDSDDPQKVRLRIDNPTDPRLDLYAGALIDVDKTHGFMISRIERSDEHENHHVYEAVRFDLSEPGLWIPVEVTQRSVPKAHPEAIRLMRFEIDLREINPPIDESLLTVQFPEGSKVREYPSGQIHYWGKDAPARTFTSDEQFLDYLYARAREVQGASQRSDLSGSGSENGSTSTILVVNIVIIVAIIILTLIRRRVGTKPSAPAQE